VRLVTDRPLDPSSTDPETTLAKVRLLSAAALYFNALAVADFGGRTGRPRGEGLVEQIVGAAFQTFEGHDPHPDPFDKAASLLRGIVQGHPFVDGNKRTGFLLAAYWLSLVGLQPPPSFDEDDAVSFTLRVSAGEIGDLAVIAATLRRFWGQ
jgi:death-on-curing protein